MVNKGFYTSPSYRAKQRERTKANWLSGRMDFLRKAAVSHCARPGCKNTFESVPSDRKMYCSHACSAIMNNHGRAVSFATKSKISRSLAGRKYPDRVTANRLKRPLRYTICANPKCRKKFEPRFWRPATNPIKYCSRTCAMKDIGGRPTSPRAARAKAGVRGDVSPTIYFFSRWEANYARLLNYLGVKWIHQPKTFQLKSQRYTPDFYLPKLDTYIEVKNYLSDYSKNRDRQFREMYPELKLVLILKEEYLALQKEYAPKIKEWEYNNSPIKN